MNAIVYMPYRTREKITQIPAGPVDVGDKCQESTSALVDLFVDRLAV